MSDIYPNDEIQKHPVRENLNKLNEHENRNPNVSNESITLFEEPDRKWSDIMAKYEKEREEVEQYLRNKNGEDEKLLIENHPVLSKLNLYLFPLLCQGLFNLLEKVRMDQICYRQKSAFNGIDYLSEYLYNMNINYPERRDRWTYIFDMDWVQEYLGQNPRPFYPFSLIWSREYAALKIQSFMRGYWVRRREDVQEVRVFWKVQQKIFNLDGKPKMKDYKLSKETDKFAMN